MLHLATTARAFVQAEMRALGPHPLRRFPVDDAQGAFLETVLAAVDLRAHHLKRQGAVNKDHLAIRAVGNALGFQVEGFNGQCARWQRIIFVGFFCHAAIVPEVRLGKALTLISDSSRRIADIISVIDGIAFQTNILALNAAVEAARAGEQGRGFAVVASEVRSLAGRSAAAAREIKALIEDSVNKVENGSRLVADAGQTIAEVVAQVRHVNDLIAEITAASAEQTAGITQVGQAVNQLDTVTQKNAAMVEESMASAIRMGEQAQRLVDAVKVFAA